MKKWLDPEIRWPMTVLHHWFLQRLARGTIYDYPDVILWVGALLLTCHLIRSVHLVRKGTPPLPIGITNCICTVAQIGILNRLTDVTGIGSGLALFFYQVMLVVFLILTSIALLIAYCVPKENQ